MNLHEGAPVMGFCRCHIVKTAAVLLLVGRRQFYERNVQLLPF